MIVNIITYCQSESALTGNLLTLRTIRTGFPNATVRVFDNDSTYGTHPIQAAAKAVGASWTHWDRALPHADLLAWLLDTATESCVILDPDLLFWDRCDQIDYGDAWVAGRLIPAFHDPVTQCDTVERLHTSFLVFPRPEVIRTDLAATRKTWWEFAAFRPVMLPWRDGWFRYDTGACLYHAIPDTRRYRFGPTILDRYDHLFCGTHLDQVIGKFGQSDQETFREWHDAAARGDYAALKGIWRRQDAFFLDHPPRSISRNCWEKSSSRGTECQNGTDAWQTHSATSPPT